MASASCFAVDGGIFNATEHGGATPCDGTRTPGYYDAGTGVSTCCQPGDTCGASGICRSTQPNLTESRRYYVAGCNDPNYAAPNCLRDCRRYDGYSDIVFVPTLDVWACCAKTRDGSNRPNCSDPLLDQVYNLGWGEAEFPGPIAEPFVAPRATTIASATATTTSSGGTSTGSIPPSASATDIPSVTSGLSTGTKIGLGVGISVGTLAMVAVAVFLILRRRRRTRTPGQGRTIETDMNSQASPLSTDSVADLKKDPPSAHCEIDGASTRVELDTPSRTHELLA